MSVQDIKFTWDFVTDVFRANEHPVAYALVNLAALCASGKVNIYGNGEEGVRNDTERLWRISGLTKKQLDKYEKDILYHFEDRGGRLFPRGEWYEFSSKRGFERPTIPAGVRSSVMQRDNYRCVYCGDGDGPFDIDHIVPIVRGGHATDKDNLVCACATCNRSKGAKTVEEWRQ